MKRIVVTGANKGIGRAIVARILQDQADATVWLGSRDPARGQTAVDALLSEHPEWKARLALLPIDVASDGSVREAAQRIAEAHDGEQAPLYGLVNNAGIGFGAQTLRQTLEVNTLGVRRVCEAFLPLLQADGGRIVNVTSASGPNFVASCSPERQRFFVNPPADEAALWSFVDDCIATDEAGGSFSAKGLGDGAAYGLSKACSNAYTVLLARQHGRLHINACTPGYIETDMTRPHAERSGRTPAEMGMKPPEAGAKSAVHLLFGPVESGHYYGSDALRSPLHRYRAPGDPAYTGEDEPA